MKDALIMFTPEDVRTAAAAIANALLGRRGMPPVVMLEMLPPHLLAEVLVYAQAALDAVREAHSPTLELGHDLSKALGRLTPREREVADLVCSGMTCKQAAQTLAISVGTAKIHLTHAYQKVGVSTRAEFEASYILSRDKRPRIEAEAAQ